MKLPPPKPQIKIEPFNSEGETSLAFNQNMVAPDIINQEAYEGVFEVCVESGLDGSKVYGSFLHKSKRQRRNLGEAGTEA